jgi:hypothetical protein
MICVYKYIGWKELYFSRIFGALTNSCVKINLLSLPSVDRSRELTVTFVSSNCKCKGGCSWCCSKPLWNG